MTHKHLHDTPSFSPRLYSIAALVMLIIVSGVWLISRYLEADLARDLQTWQEKLNLIAESRKGEIDRYVADNLKELRTLADNPSLQLYMSEKQMAPEMTNGKASEVDSGQKAYLRNLLLFTAERAGFSAPSSLPTIHANIPQDDKGGLAVIDNDNRLVVSSSMSQATRDLMIEQVKNLPVGQDGIIDIQKDKDGVVYIGFVASVFGIQGEHNPESQIGRIVGIKIIQDSFFGLLKHPGSTEKTLEAILVRLAGNDGKKIDYISPLLDESAALSKQVDQNSGAFAEAMLIENVGNFVSQKKDYRDKVVIGTSRQIAGTSWILVVKIDKDEALKESGERRNSMMVFFFLIIVIIVLLIIAIWWHAHSLRSMMMSHHFRKLAARAMAQEHLLRLVADHQPEPIYILDQHNQYQFANRKTVESTGISAEHIVGKSLVDVRGTARAALIGEQCAKVIAAKQISYDELHMLDGKEEKVVRFAYIPLDHIPVVSLPPNTPGVLIVEQDISDVVHERERRLSTHHQLVQTLLKLVDKRDPFAANHSLLVSQVAHEVAIEMELDNVTVETTRFAASLMNVGKIVVPTELLTKTESLTADEKRIIRESLSAPAELLRDISFEGPVAETLSQWQEKWDGSGPLGLQGEQILVSSRIIAVANAFIGMISPRSWRTAIPIGSANKFLLEQCDTAFDRRVVVALINYVENHSGRAFLNGILHNPQHIT
jgi:HD-GYP domain-containing protein (c-di-GMP phosphodiesterase class II)